MRTPPGATSAGPGDQTAHPWDRAADGWHRHAALINTWLGEVTEAMIEAAGIQSGFRVLDIAAGAGGQTHEIARRVGRGGHVLATDVSQRVVELARESAHAAGLSQVKTLRADAQSLDLRGADFDAAVCRLGLMFCTEPHRALAGVAAALRPGGRICALVFSSAEKNPCIATMTATALRHAGLASPAIPPPGSLFSLGDSGSLAELLQAAGFFDVEVRTISAPFRLPSARHYVEFVRSSGSPIIELVDRLSPPAQAEAWAEMVCQLEVFGTASGWAGPNELLLCSGRVD